MKMNKEYEMSSQALKNADAWRIRVYIKNYFL